jgi:hypothetical protein
MKKTSKLVWVVLATALLAAPCFAQAPEAKPEVVKYFRLDFTVKELENGKVVNTRSYSASASTQKGDSCSIRTGDKIPTQTSDKQFTYLDVGTSIDCNTLRLIGDQLALHVSADISGMVLDGVKPDNLVNGAPVIRQNRWNSSAIVPVGKPITLFSSDGTTTKRQTQLELTATPIP